MEVGKRFKPYMMFIGSFIPNVLMEYNGISPAAKLLWARLAQHAGKGGICYPAQSTLAKELGISRQWVNKLLADLVENGFIKIIHPKGRKRLRHESCRYHFLWHNIFVAARLRSDPKVNEPDEEEWLPNHTVEKLKKAGWRKSSKKERNDRESYRNYDSESQNHRPGNGRKYPKFEVFHL